MTVSDDFYRAEGLSDVFRSLGKKGLTVSKRMARIVLKNPSRDLDMTANFAAAEVNTNPKNVMSTLPELITIYNTYKGSTQVKLYKLCYINGTKYRKFTPIRSFNDI